jgi:putative transposase
MKKGRFTENQIVSILKEADAGAKVKEICRRHGISDATFYNWKSRYGGMQASDLKRLKETEAELSKLKRMYADLSMENDALKDLIEKNSEATREESRGSVPGGRPPVNSSPCVCRGGDIALELVSRAATTARARPGGHRCAQRDG